MHYPYWLTEEQALDQGYLDTATELDEIQDTTPEQTEEELALECMKKGMNTGEVLNALFDRDPTTKANRQRVAWYRWRARKRGDLGPNEGGGKGANRRTL